ncbi:MAG: hypothetical protein APF80_10040 [Alphaproteobacteria bacterium BRH_c36]|nr:MAG: hypothetical protein APF80_10040 [Alphaproteobacteria bacterium BRH_c36]
MDTTSKRRRAVALRHVSFEGLAILAPLLETRGYEIEICDAVDIGSQKADIIGADLLIVLGGPVGAYETDCYPFLRDEIDGVAKRLAERRPTLGICLGAQLMAVALGARVYPGRAKEIGWAPVTLSMHGAASPLTALDGCVSVLHWHGDTFDLPPAATRLASTPITAQQAFSLGRNALALQFHGETDGTDIEHWLMGHACEACHRRMFAAWLDQLDLGS